MASIKGELDSTGFGVFLTQSAQGFFDFDCVFKFAKLCVKILWFIILQSRKGLFHADFKWFKQIRTDSFHI